MKKALAIMGVIGVLFALLIMAPLPASKNKPLLGFSYSLVASNYLGLDWQDVFEASLDDLKPTIVRLPLYWTIVEPEDGLFDWSVYDAQIKMLEERGIWAVLAIGHKQPRWPECFVPAWLDQGSAAAIDQQINEYLQAAVEHFRESSVLYAWQVENESLFPFGDCPVWSPDRDRLEREIVFVKTHDPSHPVFTTDSGELSLWWRSASTPVDGLGISVYRAVFSGGRVFRWPVNPYFYRLRRALVRPFVPRFLVSELQTEPWGSRPVTDLLPEEIEQSFAPEELAERVDFASRLGAEAVLTWGVEWWYYMRGQGDERYWNAAKSAFGQ